MKEKKKRSIYPTNNSLSENKLNDFDVTSRFPPPLPPPRHTGR